MKFLLNDKDFDSCKANMNNGKWTFELKKTGKNDYSVFYHTNEDVYENGTYTKEELKMLWMILSSKM